jgi:hypothetical protein
MDLFPKILDFIEQLLIERTEESELLVYIANSFPGEGYFVNSVIKLYQRLMHLALLTTPTATTQPARHRGGHADTCPLTRQA